MRKLLGLILTAIFAFTGGMATASERVALVVANSRYQATAPLENPARDAALIGRSLAQAGFSESDIIRVNDADKVSLERALRDFRARATGARVALIYYAGHGIEVGGQNYLIPVDAQLSNDRDVDLEAVRLETLLQVSEGARLRVIILDACRNNPFLARMTRSMGSRAVGQGLAVVEPQTDTLVVYSTRAGAVALDGDDENSPFARALAQRLPEAGVELNMLFRRVRDDVLSATERRQEPFMYGSLSGQEFFFVQPEVAQRAPDPVQVEALMWQGALAVRTRQGYQSYLNRFPDGLFAEQARALLQREPATASAAPQVVAPATVGNPFILARRSNPASDANASAVRSMNIQRAYAEHVLPTCRSAIAERYPFSARGTDADPAALASAFGVGSALDTLLYSRLQPLIDTSGPIWRWRDTPALRAQTRALNPGTPDEFSRLSQVRDLMTEGMRFTVELVRLGTGVDEVELVLGDQSARFRAGQSQAVPFVWTLDSTASVARVTLFSGGSPISTHSESGPWAIFRLMDAAERANAGTSALQATFREAALSASLKIVFPNSSNVPFGRGGFWSFRCPEAI